MKSLSLVVHGLSHIHRRQTLLGRHRFLLAFFWRETAPLPPGAHSGVSRLVHGGRFRLALPAA